MATKQILVVGDDAVTARFIASLLREHGYDVLVAEDGAHALELVDRHELAMVVSDLVMPYRDGYSVLRAIRRNEKFHDLPADVYVRGFVTAYAKTIVLDPEIVVPSYMTRVQESRAAGPPARFLGLR